MIPQFASESENTASSAASAKSVAISCMNAPPGAVALHHGNGRLAVHVKPLPAPPVGCILGALAAVRIVFQCAEVFLEVLSRREVAAGAGDHDDPDVVVEFQFRQSRIHFLMESQRPGELESQPT